VSALLDAPPYAPRAEDRLFAELRDLTRHHAHACEPYGRIAAAFPEPAGVADLPFVHVGLFKELDLRSAGARHSRTLLSSATTSGVSSRIALDEESSARQSRSVTAILREFVGGARRPLLVLDDPRGLRGRGEVSARIAAALSLKELATDLHFVASADASGAPRVRWDAVARALEAEGDVIVYGFTWILWTAWARGEMPDAVREALGGRAAAFIHSGGWKKLEAMRVDRATFDGALLAPCGPGSLVVDYYGLVEQVGVVYPLCEAGARHVPLWADVIARDPHTLAPLGDGEVGQLQLLNTLPLGGPYHSVLTEDLGRVLPDGCPCGRAGRRFELVGRVPKAEVRGCANV
jgi:hypothetical protein